MGRQFSKLVNGRIVPCTLNQWAEWFEDFDSRVIEQTDIGDVKVSTVFLGMDHGYGEGPQILFETMVFGGELDQEQRRYATMGAAKIGHFELVDQVRSSVA